MPRQETRGPQAAGFSPSSPSPEDGKHSSLLMSVLPAAEGRHVARALGHKEPEVRGKGRHD